MPSNTSLTNFNQCVCPKKKYFTMSLHTVLSMIVIHSHKCQAYQHPNLNVPSRPEHLSFFLSCICLFLSFFSLFYVSGLLLLLSIKSKIFIYLFIFLSIIAPLAFCWLISCRK